MAHIVVNTHIFRRLLRELVDLLKCISSMGDTIIYSHKIENEYRSRRDPTCTGYKAYLDDIKENCNLRYVPSRRIEEKFKRYKARRKKVKLSKHQSDNEFIKLAISEQAKYIISYNKDLYLPPFRINNDYCNIVLPYEYIQENCPAPP